MAEGAYAKLFEVGVAQLCNDIEIDVVRGKGCGILGEAQVSQPLLDTAAQWEPRAPRNAAGYSLCPVNQGCRRRTALGGAAAVAELRYSLPPRIRSANAISRTNIWPPSSDKSTECTLHAQEGLCWDNLSGRRVCICPIAV
jgi:hypothetical protein